MEIVGTSENFENEVLKSDKPVLVDFFATWCGPCSAMSPIISEIASEINDIKVVKVNIDENMDIARKYRVVSIPTLISFKNGEILKTLIGLKDKSEILEMFNT